MRIRSNLPIACLAAALALAVSVSTAAARRIEINETGFRALWQSITFILPLGESVKCELTLEGSFHSDTMVKSHGSLVGHVTRMAAAACLGGRVTPYLETLPWHVTYEGFAGTLPEITRILFLLTGLRLQITNETGSCNVTTRTERHLGFWIELVRENDLFKPRDITVDSTKSIELEGGGVCGFGTVSLEGVGALTKLNQLNRPLILLI